VDADRVIAMLGLQPHPEGGHYRQTWRDEPESGARGAGSAIYYLLRHDELSAWHRVDATEVWHVYAGGPLELSVSFDRETYLPAVLGHELAAGQEPQFAVPAGAWQSARSLGGWTLAGCTVSPAFEFSGFELADPGPPRRLGPIVGPAWLATHRAEVVVCDVRWYLDGRSGLDAYRASHLPGAVFVDLDRYLAGPPSPAAGRHPLPDPEVFAAGLTAAGVSPGRTVVAYDDQGGMAAGRLVWLLRILGEDAVLLDGGLPGWPGPVETGDGEEPASGGSFPARPWPASSLAAIDEVAARVDGRMVVDARAAERYRGEVEPVDARAGHIPGAVSLPFAGNQRSPAGPFLPIGDLRARFEAAGVGAADDVIAYCGSGVSACHDLLAMEAAGFGRGRLYPGSWSQWAADPERPAVTGDAPG
jgi:thiosulfate/3-mercaptopyruvate sulfurtransferase